MKENGKRRSSSRYGEKTVVRRVPVSVVPLLDCLLDKIKRLAKNDPKKTIAALGAAALKAREQEEERYAAEERRLQKYDVWRNDD